MRTIFLLLIVIALGAGAGFVAVVLDDQIAQTEPKAYMGLAVKQADGTTILPIRLEPVEEPGANRFTLDLGEPVRASTVIAAPGTTLVPLDRGGAEIARRYRVTLARSAATRDSVELIVPLSSMEAAKDVTITVDGGALAFLASDLGLDADQAQMARAGLVAGIAALVALLVVWLITSAWMSVDSARRKKAQGAADRLADRNLDLERERDKLKKAQAEQSDGDAREAAFWRDAVIGFLNNRNVEQAEIDRLLASIQVALRGNAKPEAEPKEVDESLPSLVARRD